MLYYIRLTYLVCALYILHSYYRDKWRFIFFSTHKTFHIALIVPVFSMELKPILIQNYFENYYIVLWREWKRHHNSKLFFCSISFHGMFRVFACNQCSLQWQVRAGSLDLDSGMSSWDAWSIWSLRVNIQSMFFMK